MMKKRAVDIRAELFIAAQAIEILLRCSCLEVQYLFDGLRENVLPAGHQHVNERSLTRQMTHVHFPESPFQSITLCERTKLGVQLFERAQLDSLAAISPL